MGPTIFNIGLGIVWIGVFTILLAAWIQAH